MALREKKTYQKKSYKERSTRKSKKFKKILDRSSLFNESQENFLSCQRHLAKLEDPQTLGRITESLPQPPYHI